ncbi:MAG: polysaccharide deacetylase family protein, partial [Trichococcus sp.]|uniref:polysaccharide deacetylase family protein n=1 Tax=Trichococcus sp. TaxID=1985464 RepID=UPI003C68F801
MKKRFMILPPFLVIFTIYGALTDVSAATEGTTGITETTLQEPILNEQPPGIPLPETVMDTADANTPATTPTESPSTEVPVPDNQIPETSATPAEQPLAETADPQPTTTETTPPATTPAEEAILLEATDTTPTTTETPAPDTTLPIENPTELPVPETENPIVTEVPVESPTVPTEPSEVSEEPAAIAPIEEPATIAPIEEPATIAPIEEPMQMMAAAAVSNFSGTSQIINSVNITENVIALTFDDGHSYGNLSDILYNLNYLGVKATFFMNGDADASLLQQIVADGHQLANHTYSHGDSATLSSSGLANDINLMEDYIQETTGTSSLPFFRLPYGSYNSSVLDTVGSLGYQYTIGWDVDTLDWTGISATEVSNAVVNNVRPGSIVLMHASVGAANTPESLWYSIAALKQAGYGFSTVSDLLALGGYFATEEETPIEEDYSDDILSEVINQVSTGEKTISLTISDASDAENVREILANLATMDVKATFFLNGLTDPTVINEIIQQGHEIGNHTYTHDDATAMTVDEVIWELNAMETLVQDSTGGATTRPYFRAPMGATNDAVLATAASMGYMYTIGWTVDTRDWSGTLTAAQVSSAVVNNLAPGAIFLMHGNASANTTPAALLQMITAIRQLGYNFATISGLLALEGSYPTNPGEEPGETIPDPDPDPPSTTTPSEIVNQVNTDVPVISLTISDASGTENVRQILNNLALLGIKATFFLNGMTDPSIIDEIIAQGHEIGNHTYSHEDATQMTQSQLTADLNNLEQLVQDASGISTIPYFRAPMGETNSTVLATAGSLGYQYAIGWTIETRDWSGTQTASQISTAVVNSLSPGAILLLHGSADAVATPAAILQMVAAVQALGYRFETITGLLAYQGIYVGEEPVVTDPVVEEPDYGTGPSRFVSHVDTGRNVIALTFDDGDDYTNLADIIYNLNYLGVKATFFLNGTTDPGLMAELVTTGHQLSNHTYSHNDDSTSLSADELAYDLELMEDYILQTTGVSSKPYFRAPAGVYNDAVLETLGSLGYAYTIGWTQDTRDWEGLSETQIAASVTDYLDAGSIYLMHANPTAVGTPQSLWYLIAEARSQGYEFVTIDELMALEGVYDDGSDNGSGEISDGVSQFIEQVDTNQKVISLTFDDLGDSEVLQGVLDALAELDVKATFFADGTADPDMLYQVVSQGHELGNHSYSHEFSTYLTIAEFTAELNALENKIVNATGATSRPLFRPPYGDYDQSVLETLGSLGYTYTVGWSVDTLDYLGTLSSEEIAFNVLDQLSPGAIYLMHAVPESANTPGSLYEIITSAREAGYSFATISDLIQLDGVYLEDPTDPVDPVDPVETVLSQLINQVTTGEKVVSLTISDASDADNLREILANLATLNVKATFFLNGLTDPTLIDDIIAQGHEIGNHTFSHDDATQMTAAQLTTDLNNLEQLVQNASGTSTKPYFRAPMGATNTTVLTTAGTLGYDYTIGWTVDTRDWSGTMTAAQVSSAVVNNLTPGSIFLLHGNSSAATTPAALLEMIAAARALGYEFTTITGLLALQGIYPDPVDP